MLRYVIAYASQAGQTEKIAHHVARRIEDAGHVARLVDLRDPADIGELGGCDGAVVAGAVHMGAYERVIFDFVAEHAELLNRVPSAFLSVSLAAASEDPKDIEGLAKAARLFEDAVDWHPDHTVQTAGAIHDRALNPIARFVLHRIVESKGVELDPSGNTEFTDWKALDQFVSDFMAEAAKAKSA